MKRIFLSIVIAYIPFLGCKSQIFTCPGVSPLKESDFTVDKYYQQQFLKTHLNLSPKDTAKCVLMGYAYDSPQVNIDSIKSTLINVYLTAVSNIQDTFRTVTSIGGNYYIKLNPGNIRIFIKNITSMMDIDKSFILSPNTIYNLNIIIYPNSTYKLVPVELFKISDILKNQ